MREYTTNLKKAKETGLDRKTVRKYLINTSVPEYKKRLHEEVLLLFVDMK
ncbi:MAG: hypothetical protein K8R25_15230 [Methanosarcinales archaeon]|nr:hypothetical protein [Methanosarcinales archaeon]